MQKLMNDLNKQLSEKNTKNDISEIKKKSQIH